MAEHEHHNEPSRCCEHEPAERVLIKLRQNPPTRMGYQTPNGWSGESEADFAKRIDSWRRAVQREGG